MLNPPQEKLTDKKVKNFTSDWNDGTTIANLVDGMEPGLCPEFAIMNPETPLENATRAMTLADDWLGIPQVRIMPLFGHSTSHTYSHFALG